MTVDGDEARIWFDHTGSGLEVAGGSLGEFVIAGPDHVFHPAEARIDGSTVIVSSDAVGNPAAVRYGWRDDPVNTLRNSEGLPASPFRTDRWVNGVMPEK
jgi:sialate O-acetylesterase